MVLQEIYQSSIDASNKAICLIRQTNELYNEMLNNDEKIYSLDLHSCVINGAFLSLFTTFESFLQNSFICYMMGCKTLNNNQIERYVLPQTEEQAISILKGINRHADFTNRNTILKLASNFFKDGGPYCYLNLISSEFEDMKNLNP